MLGIPVFGGVYEVHFPERRFWITSHFPVMRLVDHVASR
jgi:hypothetical protein